MTYKYDVFVSYHRERTGSWVKDHFVKFVDRYLEDKLGRKPSIFIDRDIETGGVWPRELVEALGRSKCLVGIWCPSYFESKWCQFECLTMLQRIDQFSPKSRLLLPVIVSNGDLDGEGFPGYARVRQWIDCREFFFEGKGFEDSKAYFDFQRHIRDHVADIAAAIKGAPRWRKRWLNAIDLRLPDPPLPEVPAPFLE